LHLFGSNRIRINRAMARIAHLALMITASLLSCSTALPSHLAVSDAKLAWKLATGGEVVAAGALSPDGETFYVGSRQATPPLVHRAH
jgi:hypothetical protein